jgi:hypothetical protein
VPASEVGHGLEEWSSPLVAAGLKCERRLVRKRQVRALIEVVRTEGPDLLVVGQCRGRLIPDAVWGPGQSLLLRRPPCPVLVVPRRAPAGAGTHPRTGELVGDGAPASLLAP